MNPLKHFLAVRRLKRSMKPDPQYRDRRLAQFSEERRNRYRDNAKGIWG